MLSGTDPEAHEEGWLASWAQADLGVGGALEGHHPGRVLGRWETWQWEWEGGLCHGVLRGCPHGCPHHLSCPQPQLPQLTVRSGAVSARGHLGDLLSWRPVDLLHGGGVPCCSGQVPVAGHLREGGKRGCCGRMRGSRARLAGASSEEPALLQAGAGRAGLAAALPHRLDTARPKPPPACVGVTQPGCRHVHSVQAGDC